MDKHFPKVLQMMATNPQIKKYFLLEYPQEQEACPNCGGVGFISFFLATSGPFDEPAGPGGKHPLVSKWHDGKWWCAPSGDLHFGTISSACPDCSGKPKPRPVYVHPPEDMRAQVHASLAKIEARMSGRR